MCSLYLYYRINFDQLSTYVASRLRKNPNLWCGPWAQFQPLLGVDSRSADRPSYPGVSPAFLQDGSGEETAPSHLCYLPEDPRSHMKGRWRSREEREVWAPFSFSNLQLIVRRKPRVLWHTTIHVVSPLHHLPNIKQKKEMTQFRKQNKKTKPKQKEATSSAKKQIGRQWATQSDFNNGIHPGGPDNRRERWEKAGFPLFRWYKGKNS